MKGKCHEKQIKRSLTIIGILFIFIGIFVDFSWLKSIGNSYAEDGVCEPFEILDSSLVIFPIIGSAIFTFSIKYFNDLLLNKTAVHGLGGKCKDLVSNANAASCMASEIVGCACMVLARSSALAENTMARTASAINSDALWPIICTPRI